MTEALNPEPLLRALHEAGIRHVIIGGFAVNAHGVIRPSRELDIVPDSGPANLERLAALLARIGARHVGQGDLRPEELPFDPTRVEDLQAGANFRLRRRSATWTSCSGSRRSSPRRPTTDWAARSIEGVLGGVPLRVCGRDDLIAMKRAAGRPRDLDDLQRLGADSG